MSRNTRLRTERTTHFGFNRSLKIAFIVKVIARQAQEKRMKMQTLLFTLIVALLTTTAIVAKHTHPSILAVNAMPHHVVNIHSFDVTNAKVIYTVDNTCQVNPYLVTFDTSNQLLLLQCDMVNSLSFLYAKNGTSSRVLKDIPGFNVQKAAAMGVYNGDLYVLMSSSARSDAIAVAYNLVSSVKDNNMYFMKINLNSGNTTKLYESGDDSALIGVLAIGKSQLYYVLGPYASYALVSQDRSTGEVDNITPIRDQRTGEIMLPTNLFYSESEDTLYATLSSDRDDTTFVAEIDPESGRYNVVFNFDERWGVKGRVMQRMITYDDKQQVLYGWFANPTGSFSKLFAIDISNGRELFAFDYYEQEGAWRAIAFSD